MIIRKFKESDAKKVSYLVRKAQIEVVSPYYPKKIIETLFRRWTPSSVIARSKVREIFLAVEGNKILGIGALDRNELKHIYVNPLYHKKGVGKTLIQNIEKIARKRRIKKLIVKSHINSEGFYKKMGFKRIRRIMEEPGYVEILMKKTL